MRLQNISVYIILLLFSIPILAQQQTDSIPLEVKQLWIGDGLVEFELHNVSSKPITAWEIHVTANVEGKLKTATTGNDFFVSTEFQLSQRSPEGGHLSGALQVNDFHYQRVPIRGISEPSSRIISVDVTCAVFDDTSVWGDPESANRFFNNRRKQAQALDFLLLELDALQKEPGQTGKINAYSSRLKRELGNPLQDETVRAMSENDAVRVSFLENLEIFRLQVEKGHISDDSALSQLRSIVEKQRNAARKHSPRKK